MDEDENKQMKYLTFENKANLCWLDASMALIAHNRSLKRFVESFPESQINKIISTYNEAIDTFNSTVCDQTLKSAEILEKMQKQNLQYLKKFLKFNPGEPDSAFCALLNLISQDKSSLKEYLNVSCIWKKQCTSCGKNSKHAFCKTIITMAKVNIFHPESPSSIYTCTCKSEQEMKLIYKELPPCLIFHFETGVSVGTNIDFPKAAFINGREYQLTSIIILKKSRSKEGVNHFITWIRNPFSNTWLECNDLKSDSTSFSTKEPRFYLKDIYITVFEAFDDLGRMNELATHEEQDVENINVEMIEISDDEEEAANTGLCHNTSTSQSSKLMKSDEISNFSKNSFSEADKFKKEMFTDDKKDIALQNLKIENTITEESTHEEPPLTKCRFVEDTSDVRSKKKKREITEDKNSSKKKK